MKKATLILSTLFGIVVCEISMARMPAQLNLKLRAKAQRACVGFMADQLLQKQYGYNGKYDDKKILFTRKVDRKINVFLLEQIELGKKRMPDWERLAKQDEIAMKVRGGLLRSNLDLWKKCYQVHRRIEFFCHYKKAKNVGHCRMDYATDLVELNRKIASMN